MAAISFSPSNVITSEQLWAPCGESDTCFRAAVFPNLRSETPTVVLLRDTAFNVRAGVY